MYKIIEVQILIDSCSLVSSIIFNCFLVQICNKIVTRLQKIKLHEENSLQKLIDLNYILHPLT